MTIKERRKRALDMWDAGHTQAEIAEALDIHKNSVYKLLQKHYAGTSGYPACTVRRLKREAEITRLWQSNPKATYVSIGQQLGLSAHYVKQLLWRADVHPTKAERRQERNERILEMARTTQLSVREIARRIDVGYETARRVIVAGYR